MADSAHYKQDRKPARVERPDFSGYWRQVKHENFDGFLKDLGFPWVMRKIMQKYGSQSTDIIRQNSNSLRITTVNAKGSWTRELLEGREVNQRNALGEPVKATSAWEGAVHKSTLQGSARGRHTTWRFMDAGLMVVRTTVLLEKARETSMFWYLEAIDEPELQPASLGGQDTTDAMALAKAQKAIVTAQKRVMRATVKDNERLRRLAKHPDKWDTPADHLPGPVSPDKDREFYAAMFPRSSSPPSSTMSPISASPRAGSHTMQHPAFVPDAPHHGTALPSAPPSSHRAAAGTEDGEGAAVEHGHSRGATESRPESNGFLDPTSVLRRTSGRPSTDSFTHSVASGEERAHGHAPIVAPLHRRTNTPSSDHAIESTSMPSAKTLEAVLSARLQEYSENRSIATVIPLDNPLASDEPELLAMSPEQAESTQLKLAELEREVRRVTKQRAAYAAGREFGCCTVVFHRNVIPPAVRVWDL